MQSIKLLVAKPKIPIFVSLKCIATMLRTGYEAEIIRNIHLLEKSRQKSVLSYIKSLLKGGDNKNLLKFAGAFSPEDIK